MKKITKMFLSLLISTMVFAQPVLQWENRFDFEGGYESPQIMKIGLSNDIYVTGISNVDTFQNDILTIKINSDGTTGWYTIIRNDYDDGVDGLVVDEDGNCYIGGGLGNIFLDTSTIVVRFNNDGSEAWVDSTLGSLNNLVIDKDNNINVLFGGPNIRVSKYSPLGEILLEFKNDTSYSNHTYNPTLFEVDEDLNLYISGYYTEVNINTAQVFLKTFSPEGDIVVDIKYDPATDYVIPRFMQVDNSGNTYIAGWIGFYDGIFLAKFNDDGVLVWDDVILDVSGLPYDLTLDADQNPIICGKVYEVNEITEYIIKKYDQEGNEVWTDYPGKAGPYFQEVAHLVSDASGNICFAASTWPVYITETAFLMIKYDKFGNKLWEYKEDSILYDQNDYIAELALDFENNIIMALQSRDSTGQKDVLTLKFSDLTGIEIPEKINAVLTISPNPFHSTAKVSYSTAPLIDRESTITLLDLFGREISSAAFHNNYQLDRTGIPNGMYLLKVVSEDGITSTAKVIIY